jgi:hypothetical protein
MRLCFLLILAITVSLVHAAPSSDDLTSLELRDQTRACYLGFIKLYDVDYLADENGSRCVRVSYLRSFSKQDLGTATDEIFAKRHGDDVAASYGDLLSQVNAAYEPVEEGDGYTYCLAPEQGGVLLRDQRAVKRIESDDFAERFMQIWVRGEAPDGKPEWGFGSC